MSISVSSGTETPSTFREGASKPTSQERDVIQNMEETLHKRIVEEADRLSEYSTRNERRARFSFALSMIILAGTWLSQLLFPQFLIIRFAMSNPSRDEIAAFTALSKILPMVPYYVFAFPLVASITFASLATLQSGFSRSRLLRVLLPSFLFEEKSDK